MIIRKMRITVYSILILLSTHIYLGAQAEIALQLYDQKKYEDAKQEWNKLLAQGAKGEELYYNIGNTYYRLQQYPKAILYYSKALKWKPNCADCKQNLKLAKKAAGIDSFELPQFIFTKTYFSILLSLQPMIWFLLSVILWSLLLSSYLFKRDIPLFDFNKAILYLLIFLAMLFLFLSFHRDQIKQNRDETILIKESALYLSPDGNSESKQKLIPGQNLKKIDQLRGWIKVQTKDFDLGWVEESKVEIVGL